MLQKQQHENKKTPYLQAEREEKTGDNTHIFCFSGSARASNTLQDNFPFLYSK
jgi:hypothetical protein